VSQGVWGAPSLYLRAHRREDSVVTKSTQQAVDWMIDVVKMALEEGTASALELEEWLLAAIALEQQAQEEAADDREARTFSSWMNASSTLH
jgi:hypothetical protein